MKQIVTTIQKNLTKKATQNAIPSGVIALWSGAVADIPDGWVLCDGTNGTPDLRNRFVVGAGDSYAVGDIGGADAVTLTTDQIPTHTHTTQPHNHEWNETNYILSATYSNTNYIYAANSYTTPTNTLAASPTTNATGGGLAHENRPPYYALCYIMKI